MNEDVFPIEHGGCSNVMLVFRGVLTVQILQCFCSTSIRLFGGFLNYQKYGYLLFGRKMTSVRLGKPGVAENMSHILIFHGHLHPLVESLKKRHQRINKSNILNA